VSITIRPAQRIGDAMAIADIHVASWRAAYRDLLPARYLSSLDPAEASPRWLQRVQTQSLLRAPACDLWVVEDQGEVVGFALLGACRDGDDMAGFAGEVLMLYVHPRRLRGGLGRTLLAQIFDVLSERGYYWVVIWVLEGNRDAQQFYQRMGLRRDGTRRWDRFDNHAVPVIRFARALNPVFDFDALLRSYA
jgi:GNAT superfamily N-acetyltransferase